MDERNSLKSALELAMQSDRLYPIRGHPMYGFYTGRVLDGRQLLGAAEGCNVVAGLFDSEGSLLEEQRLILPAEAANANNLTDEVERLLLAGFGYEPALIRVKRFRIPSGEQQEVNPLQLALVGEDGLAVAPFPHDFLEPLDDIDGFTSEEDRQSYLEMIRRWVSDGNFVLYWGNEYHLDQNGVVIGT